MPFFTVQCSFASYDAKTVVVEAETIEQALDRAIVAANEGDGWSSLDVCGDNGADTSAPNIQTDAAGDQYSLADWSNERPPVTPAQTPRAGKRASPQGR